MTDFTITWRDTEGETHTEVVPNVAHTVRTDSGWMLYDSEGVGLYHVITRHLRRCTPSLTAHELAQ